MSKISKIPALSDTAIDTRIEKNKSIPCYVAGWGYYTEAGKFQNYFLSLVRTNRKELRA